MNETETIYRDLVLEELKELNQQQKSIEKNLGDLNNRLSTLETVVIGVDKTNGLRGDIKKIQDALDIVKPLAVGLDASMNNKDFGIFNEVIILKKKVTQLENFKLRLVTIYAVVQVIIGLVIYLLSKLKIFD